MNIAAPRPGIRDSFPLTAALALSLVALVPACGPRSDPTRPAAGGWRGEWAVETGFGLAMDTEGYDLPSAIAFVPKPGGGPKDPLYFVTELRGKVKVVTNDRTVYTFADSFFLSQPRKELPDMEGETGLAGICLEPNRGYVFVTFAYHGPDGILRNNVFRFQAAPGTFSTRAASRVAFTDIFSSYEAAVSHQIGPARSMTTCSTSPWPTDGRRRRARRSTRSLGRSSA